MNIPGDKKRALDRYMNGKDTVDNDLLKSAFIKDSKVTFTINVDNIDFPNPIVGRDNIAKLMFSDFHDSFSDVRSYYLKNCGEKIDNYSILSQSWVVTMIEKTTGKARVGCGLYDWIFCEYEDELLVESVHITINRMISFDDSNHWIKNTQKSLKQYPWASYTAMMERLNSESSLDSIKYSVDEHV